VIVAAKDKRSDRAWLDLRARKTLKGGRAEPFCVFLCLLQTPKGAYSRIVCNPELRESSKTGERAVQLGPMAAYRSGPSWCGKAGPARFVVNEQGTKMGRQSFCIVEIQGEQGC